MKTKEKLSLLWIFVTLNYLYCDVLGLMDASLIKELLTGKVGEMEMTAGFLLGASIMMEIPIVMVILSRFLKYKINRWLNIITGVVMAVIQIASLFIDIPTPSYIFFSAIEIITLVFIIRSAWKWKGLEGKK